MCLVQSSWLPVHWSQQHAGWTPGMGADLWSRILTAAESVPAWMTFDRVQSADAAQAACSAPAPPASAHLLIRPQVAWPVVQPSQAPDDDSKRAGRSQAGICLHKDC